MLQKCVVLSILAITFGHAVSDYRFSSKKECPPKESISTCSCVLKNSGPQVSCPGLESDAELNKALNNLKGYSLHQLEITQFNASSLSTEIFKGLDVEDLVLEKIEVEDASFRRGRRHFQGLEGTLQKLEIRKSFRGNRQLLNLQLDHLKQLDVIILEDNGIPEVGNDWFSEGPEKLNVLIFERNGIEVVGDSAFHSLKNLRLLAVAGNHLNTLSRSMLPRPATQLKTLDLAYNKIRLLPKDMFSGMPSLKDVNLNSNLIHIIRENTWSPVLSQLSSLSLDANPLECNAEVFWVCETNVDIVSAKCHAPAAKKGIPLQQFCKV